MGQGGQGGRFGAQSVGSQVQALGSERSQVVDFLFAEITFGSQYETDRRVRINLLNRNSGKMGVAVGHPQGKGWIWFPLLQGLRLGEQGLVTS